VLPCLLRRLLQQHDRTGAQLLALHHQHGPHFSRSLEWLLFTALDRDFCGLSSAGSTPVASPDGRDPSGHAGAPEDAPADGQRAHAHAEASTSDADGAGAPPLQNGAHRSQSWRIPGGMGPCSLLQAAFDLVRRFEQWRDVVVNVSRKTDATMWPLLFSVVGKPSAQLKQLLQGGQVRASSGRLMDCQAPDAVWHNCIDIAAIDQWKVQM